MTNARSLFQDLLSGDALPLGLGCSRLGSVNGASKDQSRHLIHSAYEGGVRFFDTSNIYAQGDSEKLLAEVLGRHQDVVICSKAGKYLNWKKRLLVPVKGLLRGLVQSSAQARQGVAAARAKPMPTCWDPAYLTRSLEGSLKRLGREQIDVFMLHSPDAEVIAQGTAIDALHRAQQAGKIGLLGVSVDDVPCMQACLSDSRIQVLQVPLHPGDDSFHAVCEQAYQQGVAIVAREILGGAAAIQGARDPRKIAQACIARAVRDPMVSLPLVGTTKLHNLQASLDAARL